MTTRILALVGSVRANSDNRQLADSDDKLPPGFVEAELYGFLAEVVSGADALLPVPRKAVDWTSRRLPRRAILRKPHRQHGCQPDLRGRGHNAHRTTMSTLPIPRPLICYTRFDGPRETDVANGGGKC